MKTFNDIRFQDLKEGLYDPNIFKAFFLAGGPGSGKTFVTKSAFGGTGLRMINSDNAFEVALKKNNLSLKMPEDESEARDIVRARAKATTGNIMDLSIKGRLGMVVDGTGRDYDKIKTQKAMLDQLGYDCYMIFVNTSLDVALERNSKRERSVPEYITRKSWEQVQSNIGKFQNLFGMGNMVIIDNSKDDRELTTIIMDRCSKAVRRLLTNKVRSYTAKRWMATERKLRRR
jgi:predicted kinase|tara:strand:- start:1445 stop:2137 length:693 start_codon:yes stop_codon:yes gene_type:complete